MSENQIDILKRTLVREKAARKQAEKILERKSAELFEVNQKLTKSNKDLEILLTRTDSQLQGVFENIVDAYVIIDLLGNIMKVNDAAVFLLGFESKKEDFNLINMVHPDEGEIVKQAFKKLLKKGTITDFHVRIITKKKEEKLVHINASIIYDQEVPVAAQGIVRDITEIKSLQIQKETLLKKLEKSNDELHEYAHVVSHDLKSPLRSIDALVSWLKEDNKGKLNETSLQNFSLIESTLEKMEHLISDVLEYSSIGEEETEKVHVNINTVVDELLKILYIPDHINVNVLKELPVVYGNKVKLQQLFQNMISNAVKFIDKEKGIIEIDVEALENHYQFSIKDNGIGIDKKFHDKIFKIFHTLNERKDSTGIGLSIVKKIVDLHEGEIWLESELNKGTTFFFTLKK